MNSFLITLSELEKPKIIAFAFALLVLLGVIDYITGHEISLSIFYVVLIAGATWFIGPGMGVIISIASAVIWVTTDTIRSEPTSLAVPLWNAVIRFGVFYIVVTILSALKETEKLLESKVQDRTESLTAEIRERKNVQEELMKQKDRLEETLKNLIQTQERLIESERKAAVGEIAMALAHHINNPLAIVSLALQTKLRHDVPDDLRHEYMQWQAQLERIRDVVREVTSLPHTKSTDVGGGYRMLDIDSTNGGKES